MTDTLSISIDDLPRSLRNCAVMGGGEISLTAEQCIYLASYVEKGNEYRNEAVAVALEAKEVMDETIRAYNAARWLCASGMVMLTLAVLGFFIA